MSLYPEINLEQILNLKKNSVVTLIGAGGKTSIMYYLARRLTNVGYRVLITTTTKIYYRKEDQSRFVEAESFELWRNRLEQRMEQGQSLTAGRGREGGKIRGVAADWIDRLAELNLFDFILVEGDGAARKPLKAPAAYEPVLPVLTDILLPLIGLKGLKRPLKKKYIHRPHLFSQVSGLALGSPVEIEDILMVYLEKRGYNLLNLNKNYRVIPIINQVDNSLMEEEGTKMARLFLKAGLDKVLLTCFKKSQTIRRICK